MENVANWCILEVFSCKCEVCCVLKKIESFQEAFVFLQWIKTIHIFVLVWFLPTTLIKFSKQVYPPNFFLHTVFPHVLIWRTKSLALGTIKDIEKETKCKSFALVYYPIHICLWYNIDFLDKRTTTVTICPDFSKSMSLAAWFRLKRWGRIEEL